jgi:hypothetical protein
MKDLRIEIKGSNSLYDFDPHQLMVLLRHQYIDNAKYLIKSSFVEDQNIGLEYCKVAEALETAMELGQV